MNARNSGLVKLATETSLRISKLPTSQEQTDSLRRHIEASDVFLGVLPESGGEHRILVKGRKILEDIAARDEPRVVRQGAIFVSCVEEAIAMRLVFGDGDGMPGASATDKLH